MKIETEQLLNKWTLFTLENDHGMQVKFLNYGGIITEIVVPDKNGVFENVVLGYRNYEDYEKNQHYFGAITGPVAGRIQSASFELEGQAYTLEKNNGTNHLHGGSEGFHQVVWKAQPFETEQSVGVKFTHTRKDGVGGYPGNLDLTIIYSLTNDNHFNIQYQAKSDQTTPLTITNHSYFNLSGNLKETITNHLLKINSDQFVELDQELIPTGNLIDVSETTFDFRKGRKIIDGITSSYKQNLIANEGYDHYFIFNKTEEDDIVVKDEKSGRILTVTTNQPGVVIYTSNTLDEGLELKEGKSKPYLGICLETQGSPASLHKDGFPNIVLKQDEQYCKETCFKFSVDL